jgi:hypothetical protein
MSSPLDAPSVTRSGKVYKRPESQDEGPQTDVGGTSQRSIVQLSVKAVLEALSPSLASSRTTIPKESPFVTS